MVQFSDPRRWCEFNKEYWKPHRHPNKRSKCTLWKITDELDDVQYFRHLSVTKSRASTLYARLQRGLLSYDKYDIETLTAFVTDRGLQLRTGKIIKSKLMELLEAADDTATFHRCDGLPPEIKLEIIDCYYSANKASMAPEKMRPTNPQTPVTLASRNLCHEALPLFYGHAAAVPLQIRFVVDRAWPSTSMNFTHNELTSRSRSYLTALST